MIEAVPVNSIEDETTLLEREQYWMDYFDSYNWDVGYNLSPTAGKTTGYKYTKEQSEALSKIIKERYENMTDEQRQFNSEQLSKALKGKKKPEGFGDMVRERQLDKLHSPGVKEKMSIAHSGENNSRAKLTTLQVIEIKKDLISGLRVKEIHTKYDCSKYSVQDIRSGNSWSNVFVEGFEEWQGRTLKKRTNYQSTSNLTAEQVREIKRILLEGTTPTATIARDYGVSFDTIHYIEKGKTWKHVTID